MGPQQLGVAAKIQEGRKIKRPTNQHYSEILKAHDMIKYWHRRIRALKGRALPVGSKIKLTLENPRNRKPEPVEVEIKQHTPNDMVFVEDENGRVHWIELEMIINGDV